MVSIEPHPINKASLVAHQEVSFLSFDDKCALLDCFEVVFFMLPVVALFWNAEAAAGQNDLATQAVIECFKLSYKVGVDQKILEKVHEGCSQERNNYHWNSHNYQ